MARIRYLKPEFFSDEDLCSLPYQTRILFAGLWCYADKAGRLEYRPKYLKAMIFPYDNLDVEKLLHSLTHPKPFINRYEIDGKRVIQIVNWEKHQKPHHTEKDSILPPAPPLMEKGMGMEKQLKASCELNNGELTVKEPLKTVSFKNQYGSFKNVKLTDEERSKVSDTEIENLSLYLASKGDKYKSHYATILNFRRRNPQQSAKIEPKPLCPKCGKENAKSLIWEDGCSLCLRSNKKQVEFLNNWHKDNA